MKSSILAKKISGNLSHRQKPTFTQKKSNGEKRSNWRQDKTGKNMLHYYVADCTNPSYKLTMAMTPI